MVRTVDPGGLRGAAVVSVVVEEETAGVCKMNGTMIGVCKMNGTMIGHVSTFPRPHLVKGLSLPIDY